jgi:DNA-binding MarR family transcriptional regulator
VVAAMLAARRLRDRLFGEGLFTDPGWDILLALYAAYLDGTGLEPAALYQASGVAPGAALRWLDLLVEAGLIVRGSDPLHRRRLRIAVTEAAADRMRHYLAEIADPFSL